LAEAEGTTVVSDGAAARPIRAGASPGSAVPLLAVAVKIRVLLFSRLAATASASFPFRRMATSEQIGKA